MGNLIAPFWYVVVAGVARVNFREFFGYGLIFALLWFVLGVLIFTFGARVELRHLPRCGSPYDFLSKGFRENVGGRNRRHRSTAGRGKTVRSGDGRLALGRVGRSTAEAPAATAAMRLEHRHGRRPGGRADDQAQRGRGLQRAGRRSRSRRRSVRSASVPPSSATTTSGTSSTSPIRPTRKDDPVSTNTWYGSATSVTWVPIPEISPPITSRRKSRESRSALVSTAMPRRRRAALLPRGAAYASPWALVRRSSSSGRSSSSAIGRSSASCSGVRALAIGASRPAGREATPARPPRPSSRGQRRPRRVPRGPPARAVEVASGRPRPRALDLGRRRGGTCRSGSPDARREVGQARDSSATHSCWSSPSYSSRSTRLYWGWSAT